MIEPGLEQTINSTISFCKDNILPTQAQYSYFSADVRLKICSRIFLAFLDILMTVMALNKV